MRAGRRTWRGLAVLARAATLATASTFAVMAGEIARVPLARVLDIAKPYPNLLLEVRLALVRAGATRDGVACQAQELGREWVKLAGQAIGPYACKIGTRTLVITTSPLFATAGGHKIAQRDRDLPAKAARVTEKRLAWHWQ